MIFFPSCRGVARTHGRGPHLSATNLHPPDFRALFTEYSGFVWRALRRNGVPERELADACQEVFLVVHRREDTFEGRSSVRTWLYGIALRVALAFRRKAYAQREQLTAELPEGRGEPEQERAFEHKETLSWLGRVLGELDAEKREAFVLYELEGLSVAELAIATDVPEGTALYRLHQARDEVLRRSRRAQVTAEASVVRLAGRQP